ncbi:uncharacterized protein LOC101855609 [Aplysia californica]|uniref:Uncharacterized protein LOC101855609 n=1 Tax=Aplysia californica TaxID=6500 RepID=A0ABM1ACW2_APLCA|nr:uncharacterized protein LOC101855609 [Aplysia californica]
MNPCDGQTCENYPDARCTPNYCTCKPTFVSGSGDVTSLCKNPPETAKAQTSTGTSTKTCASGVYVNCLTSPCKINSCGPHPEAECRDNNCDDCSAEFWIGDTEVTSSCGDTGPKISFGAIRKSASGRRPSTMDRVPPPADDTDTRIPFGPLLPTTGSGIGFGPRIPSTGSGIEFGPLIPNIPSPPKAQSPRKKCRNSCVFPPCMFRVCAAFPDAKCTNDYCGGCTARYYVNAEEVTDRCNAQIPSSTPSRRLGIFSRLRGRSNSRRQNSSPQEEKQQSRYFSPWSWLFGSYF